MATIEKNKLIWDSNEHWENGIYGNKQGLENGEKWSKAWGGSHNQWYSTLLPRVQPYLNVACTVLELAPGRGRWTQYLKNMSQTLIVVDLSKNCIDYCKSRFSEAHNIEYYVNDGKSLNDTASNTIDFIFSFDSMVHVDACDLKSYVKEFKRVLKTGGVAFIHHSNLGEYPEGIKSNYHMRASDVSGHSFLKYCKAENLCVIKQEYVPWSKDNLDEGVYLDVLSTIIKDPNYSDKPISYKNNDFLQERDLSI